MSSQSATQTYNASLILPGRRTGVARAQLTHRSVRRRALQGLGAWLGLWALAPLVMFVPPHLPWALAVLVLGLYLGLRFWRKEYIVRSFAGICPNCSKPIELKTGRSIRLPYTIHCLNCHRRSTLVLEADAHVG